MTKPRKDWKTILWITPLEYMASKCFTDVRYYFM